MAQGRGQVVSWYILTGCALVLLALRLCTRWSKIGNLTIDDFLLVMSASCLVGCLGVQQYMWNNGIANIETMTLEGVVNILKVDIPGSILYISSLWAIKAALVIFYKSLTVSGSRLQRAYNVALIVLAITWTVLFLDIFLHCLPLDKRWSLDLDYQCDAKGSQVNFWLTVLTNIFTDIAIIILPISMVLRLRMKRKQKFGVIGIFVLGVFVPVASIVRAYYGNQGDTMLSCTMLVVEIAVAIIAACLPALRAIILGRGSQSNYGTYGRQYELSSTQGSRLRHGSTVITGGSTAVRRNSESQDELVYDRSEGFGQNFGKSADDQKGIVVNTRIDIVRGDTEADSLDVHSPSLHRQHI
ncbi:hypothetical protein EJ05DRAFT_265304 [Pseudovirgaria hyperparasitica]|uniref:Rhodopsin domain-containing protein n=1 Tax=Pseudovirgaria hyperparasitica TaxID=470096 RepID=A0A6A6WHD1_9PEZI|nr:uncharacterized protein EJ05DRAFT_265304 [Pseudovirgaria hyperparasitica]KAF2761480.1 hypothetical protein EJ05DRAFT_265304 [Pseudovirgaria hyperparasitica]